MPTQTGFLLPILLAATAGTCQAQSVVLTRTAQSGLPSPLAYERAWDEACRSIGTQVTVTAQPAHGSVSVATSESVIPPTTPRGGSTGKCAGERITGNQVIYNSQPGFHGTDHVSWSVIYGNGKTGTTDVTIVVR